jgi:hypothetical protein
LVKVVAVAERTAEVTDVIEVEEVEVVAASAYASMIGPKLLARLARPVSASSLIYLANADARSTQ